MDLKEIALNKSKKRHPWELARVKVVSNLIKQLPNSDKKTVTVLDVGSGDTYMIQELSKEFGNAFFYAVDTGYDLEYIRSANQEFEAEGTAIRVFNTLENAQVELNSAIDIVLLLDVIEHVPDDVKFLKELSGLKNVTEQTLFIITVPAYQALFSSHDTFLGHYRRYDNRLLEKNIGKANLTVLNKGYFFLFPLLPRLIRAQLEKIVPSKKDPSGIGNWEGGTFSSKVLFWMLYADFSISQALRKVNIKLPGLSNFAICKKYA